MIQHLKLQLHNLEIATNNSTKHIKLLPTSTFKQPWAFCSDRNTKSNYRSECIQIRYTA